MKQAAETAHAAVAAFREPRMWVLSLLYFCLGVGFFGVTLWLPQLVRQLSGLSDAATIFVAAIPFACAAAAMIAGSLVAAVGFAFTGLLTNSIAALLALSIGATGLWSVLGVFWQLPTAFLTGTAATIGVAMIDPCGSLGGFVGPNLISFLRSYDTSFTAPLIAVATAMVLAAIIAAALRSPARLHASRCCTGAITANIS